MAQFKLVSLLASKYRNLCVVGDDDQSIYRFRGVISRIYSLKIHFREPNGHQAGAELPFYTEYPERSQRVIRHNFGRKDKTLWTANGEGDKILFKQV